MHYEALTDEGKILFPLLGNFNGYYLAGGTSLALQIGHRVSVDFDFFSSEEIPKNLLLKLKKVFEDKFVMPSINNPDELTVFVEGVKVTFLKYPFPPVEPFVQFDGLNLLGLDDIASTKAYTIGRRGAYKDYIDFYFLLKEKHTTLTKIIELCQKKYGQEFNTRLFFEQLVFLDDIEPINVNFLKQPVTRQEVQNFLEEEVRNFQL